MKSDRNNLKLDKYASQNSFTKICKALLVLLILLSIIGFSIIRILIPDSLIYQNEAYLKCSYIIGDYAVITEDEIKNDSPENTPDEFIDQVNMISIVEIIDIHPVGHGNGWIYTAKILNSLNAMKENNSSLPDIIFLYQSAPNSHGFTFVSSEMTVFCQWSELMLWRGNRYVVFGDHIESNITGTPYNIENTFYLKSYDINLPFKCIPIADTSNYTDDMLISKNNTEVLGIKPLIIPAEQVYNEKYGYKMYDLPQIYQYEEISQYNFFTVNKEVLAVYQKWCNDILDVLRKNP